jgi:hypothetical protein
MNEAISYYFKEANRMHPLYEQDSLTSLYNRSVASISKALGVGIEDLPERIKLRPEELGFIQAFDSETINAKLEGKNYNRIAGFLDKYEIPWERAKSGQVTPEFLLFGIALKEGLLPILKSEAFAGEYRSTKESFFDLIGGLTGTFRRGDRALFAFHAGEVFLSLDRYSKGKGLGWCNAFILQTRKILRGI